MKKGLFIVFILVICLGTSHAQLTADLGIGSQSTFPRDRYKARFQYFSITPALKYTGARFMVKLGYRIGLPTRFDYDAEVEITDQSGYTTYGRTKIGTSLKEGGFCIGGGMTYNETDSKTRPYIFFEYCKLNSEVSFDPSPNQTMVEGSFGYGSSVAGRTFRIEINQFRFCAGIQFLVGNKLIFFNEASIGLNNESSFYSAIFSIDLGIRYLLTK
jgi:hypothetical protein